MAFSTYVCHMTFVRHGDAEIPWTFTMTCSEDLLVMTVALSTENLCFNYADIEYNKSSVDTWNTDGLKIDYRLKLEEFEKGGLDKIFSELFRRPFKPVFVVVGKKSYHYLLKHHPDWKVTLVEREIDDRTLAAAYRNANDEFDQYHAPYTVEVNFIRKWSVEVPWHVIFTSTSPTYRSVVMGLSTKNLSFPCYRECRWNEDNVFHFPRPESLRLESEFEEDNFHNCLRSAFLYDKCVKGSVVQMAAIDVPTYHYLVKIFGSRSVVLKESKSLSEDLILAQAYSFTNAV